MNRVRKNYLTLVRLPPILASGSSLRAVFNPDLASVSERRVRKSAWQLDIASAPDASSFHPPGENGERLRRPDLPDPASRIASPGAQAWQDPGSMYRLRLNVTV